MAKCNICGGKAFGGGPGGRMSTTGKPPRCKKCQSLERHRTYRDAFLELKDDSFATMSVLQFSQDRTIEASWFENYEVSIYGGKNSLDLQKIDRDSNTYDMVICNHVLEHVPYDNAALNELGRVINEDGFVFLAIPAPATQSKTTDWGYPKEEQHGHYRVYGADVVELFKKYIPHYWVLSADFVDPVTETSDIVFFICKSASAASKLVERISTINIIQHAT